MHDIARREQWPLRESPSQGGKQGKRFEYEPPADIQRLIDEAEARRVAEPGAAYAAERPAPVSASAPARVDRDLLVEIALKLESAFLSSDALGVSFSAFVRDNRDAVVEFSRSIKEPKVMEDVHVEQLLGAVSAAWKLHTVLHAIVAADIYNQAVAMTNRARRSSFIDEEVQSFVRVNALLLDTLPAVRGDGETGSGAA